MPESRDGGENVSYAVNHLGTICHLWVTWPLDWRARCSTQAAMKSTIVVAAIAALGLSSHVHAAALGAPDSCTPVRANWSNLDSERRLQVELRLNEADQPWRGVTSPRRVTYCLSQPMPARARITKVRTFIATDRADRAELALHVVIDGYQLVTRSVHKEVEGIYDAWVPEVMQYVTRDDAAQIPLLVYAAGWSTVRGADGNMVPVNMEFGVIVEMTLEQ